MTLRNNGGVQRKHCKSTDYGATWTNAVADDGSGGTTLLNDSGVQAGLLKVDANTLMLAHAEDTAIRERMVLRLSTDNGDTWSVPRKIFYGPAAYSDWVVAADGKIVGILERGHFGAIAGAGDSNVYRNKLSICRTSKQAIQNASGVLDYFLWHFNDQAIGKTAIVDGPSIRDWSPHDHRGIARGAPTYVQGSNAVSTAINLASASDYIVAAEVTFKFLLSRAISLRNLFHSGVGFKTVAPVPRIFSRNTTSLSVMALISAIDKSPAGRAGAFLPFAISYSLSGCLESAQTSNLSA